jgi:galactokinase
MTGGGFGGSVVALVPDAQRGVFVELMQPHCEAIAGRGATLRWVQAARGARAWRIQ